MAINYLKVAEYLGAGWTTLDAQQAHEALEDGFMTPDSCWLGVGEVCEDSEEGEYYRLSAPGYLDCTEWVGPFATIEEGLAELISLYGND